MSSSRAAATAGDRPEQHGSDALARAARRIRDGDVKHIVILTGAGISTSAGIPDFRSPSTGLYHNLQRLNLPYPEAVFALDFFEDKPEPFWALAKELYPGKHFPTPTHYFFALLERHGVLARVFTQNIDTLESAAGLPERRIVEAHGSFRTAHCLSCRRSHSAEYVLAQGVRKGMVVRCPCGGLVKPDIVFFGEALPETFFKSLSDLTLCDLLIVIGTSLQVQPFASLVNYVRPTCPRLLINREAVGPFSRFSSLSSPTSHARNYSGSGSSPKINNDSSSSSSKGRDSAWLGDADDGVWELARELGWEEELKTMIQDGNVRLEREWKERESRGENAEGGVDGEVAGEEKEAEVDKDEDEREGQGAEEAESAEVSSTVVEGKDREEKDVKAVAEKATTAVSTTLEGGKGSQVVKEENRKDEETGQQIDDRVEEVGEVDELEVAVKSVHLK